MERQDELFLQALGAALRQETVSWTDGLSGEDWTALFDRAVTHHVLPMVYEAVCRSGAAESLDPAQQMTYKQFTITQVMGQTFRTGVFLQLYRQLRAAGAEPLVVKGLVCRNIYPSPDHRSSGDEDVLIPPGQFELCHKVLLEFGARPADPEQDLYAAHEVTYIKPGSPIHLELHKSLFPPESEAYGDLNRFFTDVHSRAGTVSVNGTEILTLESTDHLFYLICHAFKHFLHSGFGIRQVCDIALFANAYGAEIDWDKLLRACREIRADRFAAALFAIGEKYLTFSREKAHCPAAWAEIEVDESALLNDMLCGGVYGTVSRTRQHSSTITLNAVAAQKQGKRAKRDLLKTLFPPRGSMEASFPYLKKYPVLLPAAWASRILRYRRETRGKSTAAESLKLGGERIELLKQYGILDK